VTGVITFDTGALIAIERRSRRMQALLEEIDRRDWRVAIPAGAVAQAWRGGSRQARIAVLLSDERTEVVPLDDPWRPLQIAGSVPGLDAGIGDGLGVRRGEREECRSPA
jgi:hypothetical protein